MPSERVKHQNSDRSRNPPKRQESDALECGNHCLSQLLSLTQHVCEKRLAKRERPADTTNGTVHLDREGDWPLRERRIAIWGATVGSSGFVRLSRPHADRRYVKHNRFRQTAQIGRTRPSNPIVRAIQSEVRELIQTGCCQSLLLMPEAEVPSAS